MKNHNLYCKALSIYQIIGGLFGICMMIWLIMTIQLQGVLHYIFLLFAFLLYSYSIFSGVMLLKNKSLQLSLINQLLQLINFSILGYGYKYTSGFYITAGLNLTNYNLIFKSGLSSWEFNYGTISELSEVHINVIALSLIILIDRLIRTTRENKYSMDIEK